MNINFSTKPQITINLDPVLEAYCRAVFKTPKKQKEIVINRGKREGQAIYSKLVATEYPKRRPFCENPVTFILPLTKNNQGTLNFRFYKISKMGEEQLHDELEVLMQIWLFRVFERGYRKKYKQEEIVTAVLRKLNLRKNAVNYDTIKKFDYRRRVKTEEKTIDELLICTDPVY